LSGTHLIALIVSGVFAGVLAGLLGIGGGTVMVPILLALGYEPIQAVATSSLAIIVNSLSGSFQNWRMGLLDFNRVLWLGIPAVITVQLGVFIANNLPQRLLLIAFAILLVVNIFLVSLRRNLVNRNTSERQAGQQMNSNWGKVLTGSLAGLMAGLLGVGGGVIMVPLQMALLGEPIKRAIQTSLGVVVLTAIASTVGHAFRGNVVWSAGLILGFGGLISAQLSSRSLPKLPDRVVSWLFRGLLVVLVIYTVWQAIQYQPETATALLLPSSYDWQSTCPIQDLRV